MATDINDLPATSPHGSDFEDHAEILGLASYPNATRGTLTAQPDTPQAGHWGERDACRPFQEHAIFIKEDIPWQITRILFACR
jgi:hypothetical protein